MVGIEVECLLCCALNDPEPVDQPQLPLPMTDKLMEEPVRVDRSWLETALTDSAGNVANIRRFHHSSCHRLWSIPARSTPLENARLCKSSSISIRPEQCGSGNMATAILTRGGMDIGMSKATAVPMVMHTWDCIYLKNRNKNHIMMNTHNLPSETHHKPCPHIKICRGRDLGQGRRHFLYRQAEQG